jgi:hypothetical protein
MGLRLRTTTTLVLFALAAIAAHMNPASGGDRLKGPIPERSIEDVHREHADRLLSQPGVVGTGIGECDGKPCIKVLVIKRTADLVKRIPPALNGFPVVMEETGEIRPLRPD